MTKTWLQRIKAASKRGGFTKEDRIDAGDWPTCAVGEKLKLKSSRLGNYERVRRAGLYRLSIVFMHAVEKDNITTALSIYKKIREHRPR